MTSRHSSRALGVVRTRNAGESDARAHQGTCRDARKFARLPARSLNAIQQFALQNKKEIGAKRAGLLVGLQVACAPRLRYRVNILAQIVLEAEELLKDLQEAWKGQEGWTVAGHAVWNAYHATWCRYRELQAKVIRQIQEETDP